LRGGDLSMRLVFCGSYPINNLELPAEAVAQQLGQTDGAALVRKLYGHPTGPAAQPSGRRIRAVSVGGAEGLLAPAPGSPGRQDALDEVANEMTVGAGRLGAMSVAVDGE
jgi:hypothetical protein